MNSIGMRATGERVEEKANQLHFGGLKEIVVPSVAVDQCCSDQRCSSNLLILNKEGSSREDVL